ncbi:hypothetical protein PIB30_099584 [Stylosanthes scabra]|uniref:Aminotransferase-like plant mobile domain-containing protein n=1 Tax=Stylosanthes scabra TaxID=79078 RepID=A0ABU6UWH0_9FABA|nr:hypothetical protein [Stylosanthes scabra]
MAGDVPIVLFMYVRFHHVDRVKRQFGSEQAVPLDPVNLDGFLRASAKGDDKWWLAELAYWYGFWHNRRSRDHQIQIVPIRYPGWPTKEYDDWWAVACRRRFLSPNLLLQDPRGAQLPDDVPPAATQERDLIVLPRDAPAPGAGDPDPWGGGDGHAPHEPDVDFFSGIDLKLARFILQGEGFGSASALYPPAGGPSGHFNRYGPPNEMYEVFSCGEQTINHIAHEYIASRTSDDAVYRPGPPL